METEHVDENLTPTQPLLLPSEQAFATKLWLETQKLWVIVGPSIFARISGFTMNVVTQAFVGHLGQVPLAAITIANLVIVGFNFGLLVIYYIPLLKPNNISFFLLFFWELNLFHYSLKR